MNEEEGIYNYCKCDEVFDSKKVEYDRQKLRSYLQAAYSFLQSVHHQRKDAILLKASSLPTLQAKAAFLNALDVDNLFGLEDRPTLAAGRKLLTNLRFDETLLSVKAIDVFQEAINIAWAVFSDYSTGLHFMIEELAERTSESDLQALSTECIETLKSIANAEITHPKWKTGEVASNALVILDRRNRYVSFGQSAIGVAGATARFNEAQAEAFPERVRLMKTMPPEEAIELAGRMPAQIMADYFVILTNELERGDIPRRFCAGIGCPKVSTESLLHLGNQQNQVTLLVCSKCKQVSYCSRECQRLDWRAGHKKFCK